MDRLALLKSFDLFVYAHLRGNPSLSDGSNRKASNFPSSGLLNIAGIGSITFSHQQIAPDYLLHLGDKDNL